MKKIGLLLATLTVLLLAVGNVDAQNKTVYTGSYPWDGIMVCTDDYAIGEESYVVTFWNSKIQWRYKGTYVGESGKSYTWSLVQNWSWKHPGKGAYTETNTGISIIKCDGVPIAVAKTTMHITINANGDVAVEVDNGDADWVCL